MKRTKRTAVILMCLAALLSLFGCKDRFRVDGPDMENPHAWERVSLSRSDAYAQHNFNLTIERIGGAYVVTGNLRDDDGTEYTNEAGILLPKEACRQLDKLRVQNLPDIEIRDPEDGLLVLDAPITQIEVRYTDGSLEEKVDLDDFSIEVYQILLPHFRKSAR